MPDNPQDATAAPPWVGQAEALARAGRVPEAWRVLQAGRIEGPAWPPADALEMDIVLALARGYEAAGRHAEAEPARQRVAELAPQDAQAHAAHGMSLARIGRPAEAAAALRRAAELAPQDAPILSNLAALLQQAGRAAEAEPLYRQALKASPDNPGALRNLGLLLKERGRWVEAKSHLVRAAAVDDSINASLQAQLALTPIMASEAEIDRQRSAYADGLAALQRDPRRFAFGTERLDMPWYYLPYHGRFDRPLMEATAAVVAAKVPELAYRSRHLAAWQAPAGTRPIRVAIVTELFHNHTIAHLNRGFVEFLDRDRFEVLVFHSPFARRDVFRDALDATADGAHVLPRDLAAARAQIEAAAPDVVFFPEIGMSGFVYGLAHARLAPVQATTWGHPVTTGLPTMDYFLSSTLIEAPGAQANYLERLIELPRMNTCYRPPEPPARIATRAEIGVPDGVNLYGCPQTLFKFHPQFDGVLAQIAESDPDGRIVLLTFGRPDWVAALKERWTAHYPVLNERVLFLPPLPRAGFVGLLGQVDVLLDPLHFGAGNSLYEALVFGTPTITCPGPYTCSRLGAGAYRQLQVADAPHVERVEDYAPLAVSLAGDRDRLAALRGALAEAAEARLFNDRGAVRHFEMFLAAAVESASRGERLPPGWRIDDA